MQRRHPLLYLILPLLLLLSCAPKTAHKSVLFKPQSVGQVKTFPFRSLEGLTIRYVSVQDLMKIHTRRGIPVRYAIIDGKGPVPPYSYINWRVVGSVGAVPENSYPVLVNVCIGKEAIEGIRTLNCSLLCYLEGKKEGNCLDLGFLPSPIAHTDIATDASKTKTFRFFFYEPWIDTQREEVVFLKDGELCRWAYSSGSLSCEKLENSYSLPNPSLFLGGVPDRFYIMANPTLCSYEGPSKGKDTSSLDCDLKERKLCLYEGRKAFRCADLPPHLSVSDLVFLTEKDVLLITDKGVLKLDFHSGGLERVHEGYAWVSFGSCDYDRKICNYFLRTTPQGFIFASGGKVYKDAVYTRLADTFFGSEYEVAIKSRAFFDPPVVMNTTLVKCEKGGIVWRLAEELLQRFERTLPPTLSGIKDLKKVVDNLRLSVEASREISALLVDLRNRKVINLGTLKSLLRKKVKDKKIREAVISAVYYADLFEGGIKIEEGETCSTPYYLRVGLLNLESRDLHKNNVPLPLDMNSAGVPYSFRLIPFKLGGRYLILLITSTDPVVEFEGIHFKVIYALLSPEGRLLAYREENHLIPARPVECLSDNDLKKLPATFMYLSDEIKISPSGEIKAGLCGLQTENVENFEKALKRLPHRFSLRTVDGLKVLEVVRAGKKRELYDLYFRELKAGE